MRSRFLFAATAISAIIALNSQAIAAENHCKLYPEGGLVGQSYELVGAEACKEACTEADGCTAWSYTPHNFNPKNAPGECRMMSAVAEEVEDARDFCGRL